MRKNIIYLTVCFMAIILVSGCGGKSKMHQTKDRNPHGLANMHHQIDYETERGRAVIELTEDMKYPGIEPYEGAKYDFISGDPPQTVADWYSGALEGSRVKKQIGKQGGASKWVIKQDKLIIDIMPYGGSGSLIRYKLDLSE